MTQSAYTIQYIVQPESVPDFLAWRHTNIERLIRWAKEEHQRWLMFCAEKGYYRYLKVLNEEYSPIRFLAELHGFRKICAGLQSHEREWNKLSREDRKFIVSAYNLREALLSD